MFWAHFHDFCVQKRSCLPWSPGAFWRFSLCKLKKKVLGAFSRFLRPKTMVFAVKFRRILEVLCLQVLQKKFWAQFHELCVQKQKWSGLLLSSDVIKKSSWRIFSTFFVQKWSCLPLGSDAFWMFSHFHDLCVQTRSGLLLSSDAFWKFSLCQIDKKFWAHFLDLCVQKQSCLLWSSDAFWTFSTCKVCRKKFRVECQDMYVQKWSGLLWSSDALWKFSPFKLYKKSSGAFTRFMRPKTKQFAVKFRLILEVLCLQVLKKMLWRNSTICAPKNEAVCLEIQTHFGSSLPANFTESSGRYSTICASKNETVCCEI